MKEMETKQQEHVEVNTVHYSWKDCGIAIPQVNIEAGIGTCQACQERTYTIYKEEARVDVLCPVNDEVKELMATAGCVVWQTCKKCNVRSRTGQQRTWREKKVVLLRELQWAIIYTTKTSKPVTKSHVRDTFHMYIVNWRARLTCKNLVELDVGCFHVMYAFLQSLLP
jgi:hypothetical protein